MVLKQWPERDVRMTEGTALGCFGPGKMLADVAVLQKWLTEVCLSQISVSCSRMLVMVSPAQLQND
jgi:hypothetical protein